MTNLEYQGSMKCRRKEHFLATSFIKGNSNVSTPTMFNQFSRVSQENKFLPLFET